VIAEQRHHSSAGASSVALQATKQIRKQKPQACILMLTGSNSRTDVDQARQAGAAGYVTKDRIAAELIEAIVEVVPR